MTDTRHTRLSRGTRVPGRMRSIDPTPGEPIDVPTSSSRSLAAFIHMSDLHIMDAQSPSRVEYYDRYTDPDMELHSEIGYIGTYRPQDALTTQVLAAMVDSANRITTAPSGAPIEAVLITGDTVDNAQQNEIEWYRGLLDGGLVRPASGNPDRWEGVGGPDDPDDRYWHPEGGAEDRPRRLHGFPTIPGYFDAVQRPLQCDGLRRPWFAIHGNHDAMLCGTTPPEPATSSLSVGDQRILREKPGTEIRDLLLNWSPIGPSPFPLVPDSPTTPVTADPRRRFVEPGDYAALHLECGHGHGFTSENVERKTNYWAHNLNDHVRLIAMDTVNLHGGWHGCIDRVQLAWLRHQLENADRYVIVLSHHPAETLVNGHRHDDSEPPALEAEVVALLQEFPKVILWVAGHTHRHQITFHGNGPEHGFWHIRTSSLIDWPQQSRVIEVLESGDDLQIATYVFDHLGVPQPDISDVSHHHSLAGVSRWLAANNWQRQEGDHVLDKLEGSPLDRNVVLTLKRR